MFHWKFGYLPGLYSVLTAGYIDRACIPCPKVHLHCKLHLTWCALISELSGSSTLHPVRWPRSRGSFMVRSCIVMILLTSQFRRSDVSSSDVLSSRYNARVISTTFNLSQIYNYAIYLYCTMCNTHCLWEESAYDNIILDDISLYKILICNIHYIPCLYLLNIKYAVQRGDLFFRDAPTFLIELTW